MKRPFVVIAFVLLGFLMPAPSGQLPAQEPATDVPQETKTTPLLELSQIEGRWRPVVGKMAGQAFPEDRLNSLVLEITGDKFVTTGNAYEESGRLVLKTGGQSELQPLDIVIESGPNAGNRIPAIVDMQDKRMRVCYGVEGTRPTGFESTAENKMLLLEYEKLP